LFSKLVRCGLVRFCVGAERRASRGHVALEGIARQQRPLQVAAGLAGDDRS
jgi:hypothetical protein